MSDAEENNSFLGNNDDGDSNHSSSGGGFCGSIGCSFVGVLMVLAGTYFHYANELASVQMIELLIHADSVAIEVANAAGLSVDENNNKLVHISTPIILKDKTLTDAEFKISDSCVRMRRNVEMYQWKEKSHTEGKGKNKKTTYSYDKTWSSSAISSSNFNEEGGHRNPSKEISDKTFDTNVLITEKKGITKAFISMTYSKTRSPGSTRMPSPETRTTTTTNEIRRRSMVWGKKLVTIESNGRARVQMVTWCHSWVNFNYLEALAIFSRHTRLSYKCSGRNSSHPS